MISLVDKIDAILNNEIQLITNINFDIKNDIVLFLTKQRADNKSVKSAIDYINLHKDIGIFTEYPYSEIFKDAVEELQNFEYQLSDIDNTVKQELQKVFNYKKQVKHYKKFRRKIKRLFNKIKDKNENFKVNL